MTEWYEHMVMGETASRHRFDILEKIRSKKGLRGIYVIVPAMNPKNILDIIPAKELEKDWYEERQDLLVVGVAKGYDEALEVAGQIVGRLYRTTGSFELERML